ncbi:MAG: AMP-binding protein [Alphaproteobacteria bacterium]|nr:AMP-binding protein [Alphaproteobacteria bacterium]
MPENASHPWLTRYPAAVDWNGTLRTTPGAAMLEEAGVKWPDNLCIDFLGKTYTYKEVAALASRAAAGLQKLGVKKGDRIGLFLPNTPYYVIMYYAILKCGGVVVNFNPLYAEREVGNMIKDSGAEIMVTLNLQMTYGKLAKLLDTTPLRHVIVCRMQDILPFPQNILFSIFKRAQIATAPDDTRHTAYARLIENDGKYTPASVDPARDVAVLQYTGGTTGVPKGAMLSHANITVNALQSVLWCPEVRPGQERMMCVIPFFHVFAMTACMNFALMTGAAMILLPRFQIDQLVKTIHKKRPTLFPAVPTIYNAISNYPGLAKYDLSSIRYCISGGAGLPQEVKRDFEKLTGCILAEGYGLSESGPVASCNPVSGDSGGINKSGSIGLPLPGTVLEIVSLEDRATVRPQGEKGEVCIRGPQVMLGYWNNEDETAHALVQTPEGPRLHTGDVGYMDAEGYIFIVDRIKDMIAAGGYKIYPRHVEEAIYLHPGVEECIVAGVPDPYRGQTVKAWIKLKAGVELDEPALLHFLSDKLSKIEVPKLVEFRAALPKTLIGKLDRKALLAEEDSKRKLQER